MAKYRLCYKDYNNIYHDINLEGLKSIIGDKVTDIESIDTLTTMFNNQEKLLSFLKERELIKEGINKLYITKDRMINGVITNEKIYNGEHLFFKQDDPLLDINFVTNWFRENEQNYEVMLDLVRNYKNKYRTNPIIYTRLIDLETILENKINNYRLDQTESYQTYQENLNYFIKYEFYKLNDDNSIKYDEYGYEQVNYKNIRDFVILLKTIDLELKIPKKEEIQTSLKKDIDDTDEFITSEDYKKMKEELIKNFYNSNVSKEVYEDSLDEYASKYTLR